MVKENVKRENTDFEIKTKDFLDALKKFWVLILLVSTLLAVGVYAYFSASFVPTYTADIKICVYNSEIDESDPFSKIDDNYEYVKAEQLTTTYMDILKNSRGYLDTVISKLEISSTYSPSILRSEISIGLVGDSTNFFYIKVKDTSAQMATLIAKEVSNVFFEDIVYAGSPKIVDDVQDYTKLSPSSSPAFKNAILVFALAFVALLFIITIIGMMDNRIRSVADVESVTSYPVLGEIPVIDSGDAKKRKKATKERK
jgi:capsular polysaccharide biosynthesis protein